MIPKGSNQSMYVFAVVGAITIGFFLFLWEQPLICTCGHVKLWVGPIFDDGNSQHIADWYTLSHILHGVLIALMGRFVFPSWRFRAILQIAIVTGIMWELVEHTPWVLDMFRATTINTGYHGDSVLNAVMDYIWMLGEFFAANALRTPEVLGLVAALELSAAFIARDSLVLSTLMLVYPIEAVEN